MRSIRPASILFAQRSGPLPLRPIYVLTQEMDYEGEAVFGAYTTQALAEQAAITAGKPDGCWVVHEVALDAPAGFRYSGDALSLRDRIACTCGADAGTFHTAHPSGHAVTCATRQGNV